MPLKPLARACLLLALLVSPGASPGWAVTPSLVKDVNPESTEGGSMPGLFASLAQGVSLFRAHSSESGAELWRSDGTESGTFLLLDACPGPCSGWFSPVASAGSRTFFLVTNPETGGSDLWVTAGSPADTVQLATGLLPAHEHRQRAVWVPRLRLLFFVADDDARGFELWRSDGTPAGTYRLSDLGGLGPVELTAFQERLFFVAESGTEGPALWVSDGTPAGTRTFLDPVPGRADHHAPVLPRVAGSRLFFFAPSPSLGFALWRSDGTRQGTVPVANLGAGAGEPFVSASGGIGARLYFVATTADRSTELWTSDGTTPGTLPLTHLPAGADVRLPVPAPGGRAAFLAGDPEHGFEPWLTNGTPAGTRIVDVCPGTCSSVQGVPSDPPFPGQLHGDRLYFPANDGRHGQEMWTSNGTVAGTRLLRDLCPGACSSFPGPTRTLGGKVLFTAGANGAGGGSRLMRTDGTPKGTARVFTFPSGVLLDDAGAVPGALLFAGPDLELWRTDGTPAGTGLLKDIEGAVPGDSIPSQLTAAGDRILFDARTSWSAPKEVWESDGTAAGTVRHGSLPNCVFGQFFFLTVLPDGDPVFGCPGVSVSGLLFRGTTGEPVRLTPETAGLGSYETEIFEGSVYFVAGDEETGKELWKTDGTPGGTELVADLQPGAESSAPSGFTVFQGRLWFAASSDGAGGAELWSTDGTAEGTTRVLLPGDPREVSVLGAHLGRLWLAAEDDGHGRELWSTDGTAAGTRVFDLVPGPSSFSPLGVVSTGGRIFFSGATEAEPALWVSDGTEVGTQRLGGAQMPPVSREEFIAPSYAVVGDRLFYQSTRGTLWQSDGTVAGTLPVTGPNGEPVPGGGSLAAFAGRLFFTWQGRLWQTDGTPAGTTRVSDAFRDPGELTVAGPRLFFRATDSTHGIELWKLE